MRRYTGEAVSSKTGLNEEMATLAVDTVINFIKQKLSPEFAGRLDEVEPAAGRFALETALAHPCAQELRASLIYC